MTPTPEARTPPSPLLLLLLPVLCLLPGLGLGAVLPLPDGRQRVCGDFFSSRGLANVTITDPSGNATALSYTPQETLYAIGSRRSVLIRSWVWSWRTSSFFTTTVPDPNGTLTNSTRGCNCTAAGDDPGADGGLWSVNVTVPGLGLFTLYVPTGNLTGRDGASNATRNASCAPSATEDRACVFYARLGSSGTLNGSLWLGRSCAHHTVSSRLLGGAEADSVTCCVFFLMVITAILVAVVYLEGLFVWRRMVGYDEDELGNLTTAS